MPASDRPRWPEDSIGRASQRAGADGHRPVRRKGPGAAIGPMRLARVGTSGMALLVSRLPVRGTRLTVRDSGPIARRNDVALLPPLGCPCAHA